ncbi:transposable element Tcb2 transposase [Trichonephila clavipes]|nr:transposable element Tcb2 transposase [Trichonephila clavipes]
MSFTRRRGSERPRQTSRPEDRHIVRNARVQPTASSNAIQAQVALSVGAPVSSRTKRKCLAEGHLGSRRPLRVLPLTPTHRCLGLERCRERGNWMAAEWNQVVFSDESRFNLSSDDNPVRVWRPCGQQLNSAFALQRHTAPTAGVMLWGCHCIQYTFTPSIDPWHHDILQSHVLSFMQRFPGAIFQRDNARPHTARMSQDCLRTVTTLPWPARSPDLSPIENIGSHLGRRVGHPTSLNELGARLQQIWNEMSQDIIQNFCASMPDRIVSCIRDRGWVIKSSVLLPFSLK